MWERHFRLTRLVAEQPPNVCSPRAAIVCLDENRPKVRHPDALLRLFRRSADNLIISRYFYDELCFRMFHPAKLPKLLLWRNGRFPPLAAIPARGAENSCWRSASVASGHSCASEPSLGYKARMSAASPPDPIAASAEQPPDLSYGTLFLRFLRFGCLAFGGPVAQIAMIRRELVEEERWIGSGSFNRLLAVMQALPGPEAHELCVHLGVRAKGRLGGLLAGLGFMLPGFVLMLALAWLYTRLDIEGTFLGALFLGVQAAVLAVILRAVHRIGKHILLDGWLWAIGLASVAATLAGLSFWIVLPAAGAAYALAAGRRSWLPIVILAVAGLVAALAMRSGAGSAATTTIVTDIAPTTLALFIAGLKGGLLTFGGAYTAIPFVRNDTVGRGWMTDAQFLEGLALSGVLPAPLVIFATFAGWVCGGLAGAFAITAGMFLPAFAFSLILYERLEAIAEHKGLQAFLSGIAAGVVGLIAVTLFDLGRAAIDETPNLIASIAIFVAAFGILLGWKSKLATPAALAFGAAMGFALI